MRQLMEPTIEVPLKITNGIIMVYYCFDVGYEIQMTGLGRIRGKPTQQSFLSLTRLTPPYIQYRKPPLLIRLGRKKVMINGQDLSYTIDAKVYDFGVVTMRLAFAMSGTLSDCCLLSNLGENKILNEKVIKEFNKVRDDILSHVVQPKTNPTNDWESYTIYMVQAFDRDVDATVLLDRYPGELAEILRAEKNLSQTEVHEALKNPLSYRRDDLALIDWNAAFIYEPTGGYDLPDIIEFAVIQLLELRLYDQLIDTIIDKAYDTLVPVKFRIFPFSGTLKNLSQIKLDISEMIDRLENYLKLIGDLYLAKVYTTASNRFYLEHWKSAVRGKLAAIESIYSVSWERIQTNRMLILETAIVLLFLLDIVLILIGFFK